MSDSLNPEQWLDNYGDALYRYAFSRVQDNNLAEDLVQETLLAALQAKDKFAQKSSQKTWLIGILKHKVLDYYRNKYKRAEFETGDDVSEELEKLYFGEKDHWQYSPKAWSSPETALSNKDFWVVFNECLQGLPSHMADLFLLQEYENLSAEQLCKVFNIQTTNNVWVTLSRARMRLRHCLENRWFDSQ
jgi:RNA polymerase sigma-70 factor (ECF subfamily)